MTSLCHACAVEHATDDLGVHCTGCKVIGTGFPVTCDHYQPTREKQLEDALRELLYVGVTEQHSQLPRWIEAVEDALADVAKKFPELIGKDPR